MVCDGLLCWLEQKTLVMSLWRVPDGETKDLMIDFYASILRGDSRADALRGPAQDQSDHLNPFFWGAFICQGDPSPLSGGIKVKLYRADRTKLVAKKPRCMGAGTGTSSGTPA